MSSFLAWVYPLSVWKELSTLRRAEHMSESELLRVQESLREKLLQHAYENVPYYRRVLIEAEAVNKRGEVDLTKFHRVPFLTKDIIRREFANLKSNDLAFRRWYYNTSGGSTGEPVRLIQDEMHKRWLRAVKILNDAWTGYRPGMSKVVLWGSERDLFIGRETIRVRLVRWLKNEVWLNAFRMTKAQMREYVEIINQCKPAQILAYVESIYELARFIERENLTVYSPKAIMTSAGTLYPAMRQVIERVFQAPVYNRYGSREVGDIACECQAHGGLHVPPLTHFVEIVRDDGTPAGPGEVGEVVVTSLVNYSMPLIRYRIGDMAVWAKEKCTCGRRWPLLKQVVGRVTDTFVTKQGTRIHGEYFTHLLYFKDWIQKFQFIQEDYDRVRLRIVPSVDWSLAKRELEREKQDLEAKVRLVLGADCRLDLELVGDIPPTPSGKYRYTVSMVADRKEGPGQE